MNEKITLDLDNMTLGEIQTLEELTDMSIDDLFADGKPRGKAMRAIAFIVKRRTDKNYTFEETDSITMNDFDMEVDTAKK